MPKVWIIKAPDKHVRRFHKNPICGLLRKSSHQIIQSDLTDLPTAVPCRRCYPDSPRVLSAKRFCPMCNYERALPCRHNGGIQVTLEYATQFYSMLRSPGDPVTKTCYVWPDRAYRYTEPN